MRFERLRYTVHARRRMKRRRISEEDVLRVINDPDLTYPSYGKNVAEEFVSSERQLRVVWVPDDEPGIDARIVTAVDLEEERSS